MDINNINRDRDTSGLGPIEYDQSKVPSLIRKYADNVRTKTYGQEVREAQARNAEVAGLVANSAVDISNATNDRQRNLENTFNSLQQEITGKDVISAPEIIAARNDEANLKTRLDKDHQEVTTQLAQTNRKISGVLNISEFAGETDQEKTMTALNELNEYEHLRLTGGVLEITEPLIVTTKNVSILSNGVQRIKAVAPMVACIIVQSKDSQSIVSGISVENIDIDGNNLSDYGVLISDTVGLYSSEIEFNNVKVRGAIKDGFNISGPAWVITLNKVGSAYNGRDGIRALMSGAKQLNVLTVSDSVIHSNANNGLTLNGTENTIKNNTIERNKYGISIDVTLNGDQGAWAINNTISDNYIELNTLAQVHLKSKGGSNIAALSILENYLLASSDTTDPGTSLIKIEGTSNIRMRTVGNFYSRGGNVVNDIDGGNALALGTVINDTSNVINIGLSRIDNLTDPTTYKLISFSGGLIQNASYDLRNNKSENLLPLDKKKIGFALTGEYNNSLVRTVNVYVETDATDYSVRISAFIKNILTGELVKETFQDITETSSALLSSNLFNLWGMKRLKREEVIYFEIRVNNSNGTYLYTHVPYVETT